jgi:hypothetical protein
MAAKKAKNAKARGRVKNLPTKSLTVREARTVKGGETATTTKGTTKGTTKSTEYLKIKLVDILISS